MKRYVDGFVFTVPKKKLEAYRKMASDAGKIWMKHGALGYYECQGEDLNPPTHQDHESGQQTRLFTEMTDATANEYVFFSMIIFKSRAHRDKVNASVMKDPKMMDPDFDMNDMPFEMKKMAYGGFESIVAYEPKKS